MTIRVPYLSEETIEREAETLLAEYAYARSVSLKPPIPIEDIIEKHLKLRLEFDDLHEVLGVPQVGLEPDIFGAIWIKEREIYIDQSLDPEERPSSEGRYQFTLAHEGGGHWRLHRRYLAPDATQISLFGGSSKPSVACRSSQAKDRVEWQADCLRVVPADAEGDGRGGLAREVRQCEPAHPAAQEPLRPAGRRGRRVDGGDPLVRAARDNEALQEFVRPFAERFKVSAAAMRIRLERLPASPRGSAPRSLAVGI